MGDVLDMLCGMKVDKSIAVTKRFDGETFYHRANG